MPFRSKAQWRYAAIHWPKKVFERWVKETKVPFSALPEKVSSKKKKVRKKKR